MLPLFIHIFETSIIPIFLLLLGGLLMDRLFNLDIRTLSKLNFFILLPSYIFQALYTANFDESSWQVTLCGVAVLALGSISAGVAGKIAKFSLPKTEIFRNGIMFNNCGNIGIAIITFVYSNAPFVVDGKTPYLADAAVAVVAILVIQNITSNTLGFYQAGHGRYTMRDSLSLVFHMPAIYIAPSALLLRLVPIDLTAMPFWPTLNYFSMAFVGIAMITLGAQINRTPFNILKKDVMLATFMRLIIGPCLAFVAVVAFGFFYQPLPSVAAQTLIITYSVPTAINTALIALEMKNHPEFATQIVMATTFISSFTMPLFILLAYYMFPL